MKWETHWTRSSTSVRLLNQSALLLKLCSINLRNILTHLYMRDSLKSIRQWSKEQISKLQAPTCSCSTLRIFLDLLNSRQESSPKLSRDSILRNAFRTLFQSSFTRLNQKTSTWFANFSTSPPKRTIRKIKTFLWSQMKKELSKC